MIHYFERFTKSLPIVYTLHDPIPAPGSLAYVLFSKFSGHNYISISLAQQKSHYVHLHFVGNVYHGIPLSQYQFSSNASDYFLFMGRLVPEKGLHTAIKLALATNTKLSVGAEFPEPQEETEYFKKEIEPYLKNPLIQTVGMKEGQEKITLYGKAKALIFPIEWEEPFGMVMIEAMACGTPVIAYNRGSVSEIVRDGVTGFVIDPDRGVEGLVEAVGRIGQIDRAACRRHVEEHFTVEKMVEGYERVYQKIVASRL
jgi:glycosyltransferase involved in cell wall biosynthesis